MHPLAFGPGSWIVLLHDEEMMAVWDFVAFPLFAFFPIYATNCFSGKAVVPWE
jgi:hypothetical protein